MQRLTSALVTFFFATGPAQALSVTPIEKVLQMLSDLQAKIQADGEAATKTYEEFAAFCKGRSKDLEFEIKTGKFEVEQLEASIAKESALIDSLDTKIEELSFKITTDAADVKAATVIRGKEEASFGDEEVELTGAIDVLERALAILKREMQKGGAAMLQLQGAGDVAQALSALVGASALSSADGARLTALVQGAQRSTDGEDDAGLGAPDAAVYKGHSGDIIATLESLLETAQKQLEDARKAETSSLHTFQLLKQSLEDSIAFATKDLEAAKKGRAESSERKAGDDEALAMTSKDLAADSSSLADLQAECSVKAQEFEAATKSRNEELKALAEAQKVIAEETGGAEKLTYGLSQTSLLQLRRSKLTSGTDLAKFEAVRLVRDLARKHHSSSLAQLASRLAAAVDSSAAAAGGEDPFKKVKGLIADMIAKLEAEADADATHKAFCDKELAENGAKKAEKTAEIEKLSAKIDQMSTHSAKLKEQVAALQAALSELASSQAEMDKVRQDEHAEYVKSKADLEQGLEGVKLALKILREYYAKEDKAHAAAEGAGSSIIGLLEVIESDLTTGLAGVIATEKSAQAEYESETKENEIEKNAKEQDVKYKSKTAADLDLAVARDSSDRAGVQAELDAVLETLASLDKQCTEVAETYEARKSRREAEIAGLKEALAILEGQAVLLEQSVWRTLRGVRRHHIGA